MDQDGADSAGQSSVMSGGIVKSEDTACTPVALGGVAAADTGDVVGKGSGNGTAALGDQPAVISGQPEATRDSCVVGNGVDTLESPSATIKMEPSPSEAPPAPPHHTSGEGRTPDQPGAFLPPPLTLASFTPSPLRSPTWLNVLHCWFTTLNSLHEPETLLS